MEIDAITIKRKRIDYYQTEGAKETIAIIYGTDGSISIGITRAGKTDIENDRVSSTIGMDIAGGRSMKVLQSKGVLIEKNYLRGIHATKVVEK